MKSRLLPVIALLAIVVGLLCSPANAAVRATIDHCDAIVYDPSSQFGSQMADVQAAAQQLQSAGADVHVRMLDTLGYANLDAFEAASVKACPSWQAPDGQRKNNLVVFAASLKPHTVGIYFGEKWKKAFDGSGGEARIYTDHMVPAFKDGDFATGFVDGMNATYETFNNYIHPTSAGGTKVIVTGPSKPSNTGTIIGIVLGAIAGLLFLVFLLVFFGRKREKSRQLEEERRTVRLRASSARDSSNSILQPLGTDTVKAVRDSKVKQYMAVGGDWAVTLGQLASDLDKYYASATDRMRAAVAANANADDTHLTTGEYTEMAERYEAALKDAEAAKAASDQLDALVNEIKAAQEGVAVAIPKAAADIQQLTASVDALKGEKIKAPEVEAHISATQAALALATANQTDLSGLAHLEEANVQIDKARDALKELADKRSSLKTAIPALEARVAKVHGLFQPAADCFGRITAAYVESSWDSVKGNGTEATKRLDAAGELVAKAKELAGVDKQEWDAALKAVEEGNGLLDKAESLLSSITKLEVNLDKAKTQAPAEIAAAQADIDKAKRYIEANDDDIDEGLETDLAHAEQLLGQAATELQKPQPDYLHVLKLATDANSSADAVFAKASEEHEAAERLRRQAASALDQATSAVSKAKEYIDDHSSDVGNGADSELRDAVAALQRAHRSGVDAAAVLKNSRSAAEYANKAYDAAQRDFEDAENDRRRARQRQQDSYSGIGASSSSFGSWGSSGGGSSSGFGDFGGGGGSSISFGGGGGGGGSSSGW